MGLLKKLFTNCACPQGRMGRAMLKFMNLCHAPLTNWGLKLVDIQDGWTMLDIGCGGGATLQRLLKRSKDVKVYGIDISEESVAKAKKVNAEVLDKQVFVTQGSAEKLPYEDEKFDLVTAVETVYFWPHLPDCLKEVRRVLKQGGSFHQTIRRSTLPPTLHSSFLSRTMSPPCIFLLCRLSGKGRRNSAYDAEAQGKEGSPRS